MRSMMSLVSLAALVIACEPGLARDLATDWSDGVDGGLGAKDGDRSFDASLQRDSGATPSDAGRYSDAGRQPDAAQVRSDAGQSFDSGQLSDSGTPTFDAGSAIDAGGPLADAGPGADAGSPGDGGGAFAPCPTGAACKILPLGDSITYGQSYNGGYRVEIFRQAGVDGKNITFVGSQSNGPAAVDGRPFPQAHEGHPGYAIDNAPAAGRSGIYPLVADVLTTYKPHIVLLMIGTNDVGTGNDLANAPSRLGLLLDRIVATSPNALLVVAKIVPTTDDGLNSAIQVFNDGVAQQVDQRIAAGKHLILVDMYATFTQNTNFKTQWMTDTLHPSADGYNAMARTWYPAIKAFLPAP